MKGTKKHSVNRSGEMAQCERKSQEFENKLKLLHVSTNYTAVEVPSFVSNNIFLMLYLFIFLTIVFISEFQIKKVALKAINDNNFFSTRNKAYF